MSGILKSPTIITWSDEDMIFQGRVTVVSDNHFQCSVEHRLYTE